MEGASEVISSRNQTADKLRTKGIEVLALKSGKIDVIVSNAAANPSVDPILQTEDSVFDKLWEINVKASILLLKDAAPHLHRGSSVALAAEMVPNTRVNCIAPCFVLTNFPLFITSNEATRLQLEEKTLLGRLGTTEHMAAGAAFLASDDDAYTTGNSSHCWGNAIEAVAYVSFLVLIVCFCCWI
ncbi:Tropinone reductase-like [Arachis hypogaea]|nr:Tropinone reductase-like [Arachis hypogaea]